MAEKQQPTPRVESSGTRQAASWVGRSAAAGRGAHAFLQRQRPHHAMVDLVFRCLVRDKQIAGGVLGGGLAYSLYFWVLGMVLVLCGGLGIAWRSGAGARPSPSTWRSTASDSVRACST